MYSLLSIPRISRDWAKYVELSVVRGNKSGRIPTILGRNNSLSTRPLIDRYTELFH